MSGVEGALSTRTPRPRWPPPQGGHPAAGRPHVAAAGRPQAVAAGRPQGGRRRTATAGRPQAATAGRPQAAAVRAAAGRAWATRIACLLRVGDENSMLAAERRDRESAKFGEMKREAGGLGEFLLCPQGKANKKKLTGWPQAAAGHRNPALGLSPPYSTGGIRSKQNKLWLDRKAPSLAPPELKTVRAWAKSTNQAWFESATLIWTTSTSPDQKRDSAPA
jgi:hypothetical protein